MPDPGDSQFACALFQHLGADAGNACFSPFSVRTVFALCYLGARGRTADEMREAFRFPSPAETREQFARLRGELAARGGRVGPPVPRRALASDGPILRVANRLRDHRTISGRRVTNPGGSVALFPVPVP